MALHVRREGYYAWEKRPTREERDKALVSALKQVRKEHPCYGVQSMLDTLPEDQKVSYGKVYRVCREYGLLTKRLSHLTIWFGATFVFFALIVEAFR